MNDQLDNRQRKFSTTKIVLAFASVLIVWATVNFAVWFQIPDWTQRSQFGDMFGAVNSLFSGLLLAGVIFTIYLQRHEISLQGKELELNRNELKLQREELGRSSGAQLRQLQIELMRMSMTDPDLAVVWAGTSEFDHADFKRLAFVNLILSHWEMLFQQNLINEARLTGLMQEHFDNIYFQQFWSRARTIREAALANSDEKNKIFHEISEAAYQRAIEMSNQTTAESDE